MVIDYVLMQKLEADRQIAEITEKLRHLSSNDPQAEVYRAKLNELHAVQHNSREKHDRDRRSGIKH